MRKQAGMHKKLSLLEDFTPATPDDWRRAAEKLLKGAPYDESLLTQTLEGLQIQPIYDATRIADLGHLNTLPGEAPFTRGCTPSGYLQQSWDVAQRIDADAADGFNAALTHDLQLGQNAVALAVAAEADGAASTGQPGFLVDSLPAFRTALGRANLEQIAIYIDCGIAGLPAAALLSAHCAQQGFSITKIRGAIGFDPLKTLVQTGTLPVALEGLYGHMALLAGWAQESAPLLKTVGIDLTPHHNAGADAVQELAFGMATGVEYIRGISAAEAALSIDQIATKFRFSFAVGSNFFMEISKLRAARLLWSQIVQAFGGNTQAQKATVHACTSRFNKSRCDAHVNILRASTEALSAILGGCDSLHVHPFDDLLGEPEPLSRRLARNTQLILKEEAHVVDTIDAAGGCWYVEKLTTELAQSAWHLFQDIERRGGMFAALADGFIQDRVAQTAAKRMENFCTRREKMIGVNIYANAKDEAFSAYAEAVHGEVAHAAEQPQQRATGKGKVAFDSLQQAKPTAPTAYLNALTEALTAGATTRHITASLYRAEAGAEPVRIQPLPVVRAAEPFENLRLAVSGHARKTGRPPTVLLANFGSARQFRQRAGFATDFFQLAGFDVIDNGGCVTPAEAAAAARQSKADVVVLCSSDDVYAETLPSFAEKMKQVNQSIVLVVVGRADMTGNTGVDYCIHTHTNVITTLQEILTKLKTA